MFLLAQWSIGAYPDMRSAPRVMIICNIFGAGIAPASQHNWQCQISGCGTVFAIVDCDFVLRILGIGARGLAQTSFCILRNPVNQPEALSFDWGTAAYRVIGD